MTGSATPAWSERSEKGTSALIPCSKCSASLPRVAFNRSRLSRCPSCGVLVGVDVFPALFRKQVVEASGEALRVEDEASCFYHPKKRAVIPCAVCGRFLCTLCDVDFDGKHLCPVCLETGQRKRKLKNLETRRTLYDSIALFLAIVPMLFLWPTIVTAPIALFVSVRYWRAPTSIIPRTKVRFIIAFTLAGFQTLGWAWFICASIAG